MSAGGGYAMHNILICTYSLINDMNFVLIWTEWNAS